MDYEKERTAAYALSRIYLFEPRVPKAIVEHLDSAASIFEMDGDSLEAALGPYNRHKDAIKGKKLEAWAEELEKSTPRGWRYIPYCDEAFPGPLWSCEDSPLGLFYLSESEPAEVFKRPCVSIVGTRDMSSYGAEWCRKLVSALSGTAERPTIVSGLAFGVDITAQTAALEFGLPTIAVLGTGAGTIYPHQHEYYASQIERSAKSAIVTEYPEGCATVANSFLCRNRIIAGLSSATVLVESRKKGGGITTANIASSYSRDVFAVPGRCDDARSQGCNMLIHSRVAEPVFDCESFIKSLGMKMDVAAKAAVRAGCTGMTMTTAGKNAGLPDNLARLILAIRKNRDADATTLARITGQPLEDVLAGTVMLENDGIITCDLLGRYSVR